MKSLQSFCVAHIESSEVVVAGGFTNYCEGQDKKMHDVFERADSLMYKEKKALNGWA